MTTTTGQRVLIIDDDEPIRKLLAIVLKRRGIASDCARDGVDGWQKLQRCRYALVLLDLMMPRMSGFEVLEKLSTIPKEQRPHVVVLTAGARPSLRPDLVLTLVRKPFDVDVVAEVVIAGLEASTPVLQSDGCPEAESERLFQRTERNTTPDPTN